MNLSICNIAWDSYRDGEMYQLLADNGFSGIEIAPTRLYPVNPYLNNEEAKKWKNKMQKVFGLSVPSIQSIWYGLSENIFRSEEDREALTDYTKKAILFANCLSAGNVVFGCPKNRNGYKIGDKKRNKYIAVDFFRRLGEYAKKNNVVIGFEANPEIYNTDFMNTTEETIKFIEEVDSEGFKLNLDIGTMLYYGETMELLERKMNVISHVHISEPGLKKIEHHSIHKELYSFLSDAGYNGFVSIEMGKQANMKDIVETIKYIGGIFG